jgi:hypothetical protein
MVIADETGSGNRASAPSAGGRAAGWLISGGIGRSNAAAGASGLLKFDAYCRRSWEEGETMKLQIRHSRRYPASRRGSAVQDFLMISAFGIWALLLGLSPILAFHALT